MTCRRLCLQVGQYQPGSPQQLLHLAAVVNSNSHGVGAQGQQNTDLGVGLFPATAMLNHSCRPNCAYMVAGAPPRCSRTFDHPNAHNAGVLGLIGSIALTPSPLPRLLSWQTSPHMASSRDPVSPSAVT